jgi:hypothetical protein
MVASGCETDVCCQVLDAVDLGCRIMTVRRRGAARLTKGGMLTPPP